MELNREQIIKAIEYCFSDKPCNKCEWHEKGNGCLGKLEQSAISLIKELTEENEAISERYAIQVVTAIKLDKQVQRLTEENERLRAENEKYEEEHKQSFFKWKKLADETADHYENLYQDAKKALVADTVRKMHSMLCEGRVSNDTVVIVANQVAKEMLEVD